MLYLHGKKAPQMASVAGTLLGSAALPGAPHPLAIDARSYWMSGSSMTGNAMSAGCNALPRFLVLCTSGCMALLFAPFAAQNVWSSRMSRGMCEVRVIFPRSHLDDDRFRTRLTISPTKDRLTR